MRASTPSARTALEQNHWQPGFRHCKRREEARRPSAYDNDWIARVRCGKGLRLVMSAGCCNLCGLLCGLRKPAPQQLSAYISNMAETPSCLIPFSNYSHGLVQYTGCLLMRAHRST